MARPTAPDHDDKAAAVLAAAGQVFAQRGYEGATMLDVAQAAGFSKAGVYHYFASKEHLLHGLLEGSLREVVFDLEAADPGAAAEPAERLAVLVDAYVRSFSTRLRVVTPLLLRLELLRAERRLSRRRSAARSGRSPPPGPTPPWPCGWSGAAPGTTTTGRRGRQAGRGRRPGPAGTRPAPARGPPPAGSCAATPPGPAS